MTYDFREWGGLYVELAQVVWGHSFIMAAIMLHPSDQPSTTISHHYQSIFHQWDLRGQCVLIYFVNQCYQWERNIRLKKLVTFMQVKSCQSEVSEKLLWFMPIDIWEIIMIYVKLISEKLLWFMVNWYLRNYYDLFK